MTSTFKFFPISIFAHLLFIFGISLFIAKPDNQPMEYGRKLIMLSPVFGSYSSGTKKTVASKAQNTTSINNNQAKNVQNSAAAVEASSIRGGSSNTEAVEGKGEDHGGEGADFDFTGSILNYSEPIYPRMAIARGIEGNLKVKIKISPEGQALETVILKSSGSELLDTSAINAIKKWVFVKRDIKSFYFVEKIIIFQIKK